VVVPVHAPAGTKSPSSSYFGPDPALPGLVLPFEYEAPSGEWTHLAFVASASTVSLYANGELVGAHSVRMSLPMQTIGAYRAAFKGDLQEVRAVDVNARSVLLPSLPLARTSISHAVADSLVLRRRSPCRERAHRGVVDIVALSSPSCTHQ
jgi:hypothetical protein